jgi:hypothetical protein
VSTGTLIKKFAHNSFAGTFYGQAFTKENDDFLPTIQKQFKKDDKILMVCQEGLRLVSSNALEEAVVLFGVPFITGIYWINLVDHRSLRVAIVVFNLVRWRSLNRRSAPCFTDQAPLLRSWRKQAMKTWRIS